jgi:hypothetical protein
MRFRSMRRRAVLLPVLLPLLGGCDILTDGPPGTVHVIVDASPQEPLLLVVSSNFALTANEEGQVQSSIVRGDTTLVSGPFDHVYNLDASAGQILVRLTNGSANSETVRLRILLDEKPEYDQSQQLATGDYLEYHYTNLSY